MDPPRRPGRPDLHRHELLGRRRSGYRRSPGATCGDDRRTPRVRRRIRRQSSPAPETAPTPPADQTRADPAEPQSRDWAYLGLLAFTAVLLFRPQDQIRVLDPFHLAQVCAFAALAAMLVSRLRRHLTLVPLTPETVGADVLRLRHARDRAVLDLAGRRARRVRGLLSESGDGLPADRQHADHAEASRADDVADSCLLRLRRVSSGIRLRTRHQPRRERTRAGGGRAASSATRTTSR